MCEIKHDQGETPNESPAIERFLQWFTHEYNIEIGEEETEVRIQEILQQYFTAISDCAQI